MTPDPCVLVCTELATPDYFVVAIFQTSSPAHMTTPTHYNLAQEWRVNATNSEPKDNSIENIPHCIVNHHTAAL